MMKKFMKPALALWVATASLGLTAIVTTTLTAPMASAQSSTKATVDQAIREGLVGETAAGYLALLTRNAPQNVVNAVNEINIGRKSVYTRLARDQGVAVEVVAALTGEKLIANSPRGSSVMGKDGRWIKK